jgi:hypothetical protein
MTRITDQATLKTMRGRQIRFMRGTYGGKSKKKGSGCGWVDKTATTNLDKKMWVIVDMTGEGKLLKHTQVSHSSFRYSDWFNVQVVTFEEHLLQQYPEIEDAMEELARMLARVKGLDKKMKGSDSSLMMTFWEKYNYARSERKEKKYHKDWLCVHKDD